MIVGTLHIVGVRHHSPACARLVAHTIREARPRFVLVEGPSDMNGRIDELLLGHTLPFAIFSYASGADVHHASWSPFCAYSPEWVALQTARETRAESLFMDLPAWHSAFAEVENRYSDRHSRASDRMRLLCERLGLEDTDALWDHLFEQPLELGVLAERLATYFRELREGDDPGDRDRQREAYMTRWIAWAMQAAGEGDVVVVCGGYHAPALASAWKAAESPARPEAEAREGAARTGSYLVPYSFHRLDSFVGYESGMPSPEFYQRVWEHGADEAGETMLFDTIQHLRRKRQRVSPADAIAALTLARGLKTLRGHLELARIDVLDGLAAAVIKDALEAPLPWNRRGVLASGTDPMLVEMVAAFSGERVGKLAPGTPRPPLVLDVHDELRRAGIEPKRATTNLVIPLVDAAGLLRSRVLHRLRVLAVPGFVLTRKPSLARADTELSEGWAITATLDAEPALIEASAYGATLEAAAAARLEEGIRNAGGIRDLAQILSEAALVGIHTLTDRLFAEVRRVAGVEPSFGELGAALTELLVLYKHGLLLGTTGAAILGETIEAAFERGLWLFEGISGNAGAAEVDGALALRDALRFGGPKLAIDGPRAEAVMRRRGADAAAPPAVRGASLGFLWSTRAQVDDAQAAAAVRGTARPEALGDFLTGLFALAREEVLHSPSLLGVIDDVVVPMTRDDFLVAIPSLRLAFSYFPPREKEQIAKKVLALHGAAGGDVRSLTKLAVSPGVTMAGMKIDAAAEALARSYGLLDALDDPGKGGPP
ncbi:MAG TPA: DUF5682 family protein [Labilithrix sp.]|nr:DUF5682 family protein [Labilithrix sp.]